MELRERQKEFVEKCISALLKQNNTLGVAATGAGKTICLSAVIGELAKDKPDFKACVLAHRTELTGQNSSKFSLVNPHLSTSIYDADIKSWDGQVTFAMVQTLAKKRNLETIPKLDLLVIDEAHHITAKSYQNILKRAKSINPDIKVFGVTATPMRGDKSSLGQVFNNCSDQIRLAELVASGHLVRPKTYIVDLGNTQEKLQSLKVKKTGDYNESEVADILDTIPLNSEVVRHWKEKAGDRKTVVFCSTVEHATNVYKAFCDAGISTVLVTGKTDQEQREFALKAVASGQAQVIVNVAVLTEGWDFPPISCVILLRASSYKSTMMQMVGRGLRTIDSNLYPSIDKKDCVVLDFGISSILHGSLEQSIDLKSKSSGHKKCHSCKKKIPKIADSCPLCGFDFIKHKEEEKERRIKQEKEQRVIERFEMVEFVLKRSSFHWTDLNMKNQTLIASGFNVWSCITREDAKSDVWIVTGGFKDTKKTLILFKGNKKDAINAANSFLSDYEDAGAVNKQTAWRTTLASENQLKWLPESFKNQQVTKGDASNYLSFIFSAQHQLKQIGFNI